MLDELTAHLTLAGPGLRVDVGAHLGHFTLPLACQPGARVLAFEPIGFVMAQLLERIQAEPRIAPGTVRVLPMALSDTPGWTRLSIPMVPGGPVLQWASITKDFEAVRARCPQGLMESVALDVEVRTLDAFALEDVCSLKIDVEGAELPVLRGARETIARWRPFITCELEERHSAGCTWSVPAYLDALGYEGFFVHAGVLHPVAALDRARMQQASESPAGGRYSDPYIFEFYFVHRSQPERRQAVVALAPGGYAERVDLQRR